MLPFAATWMDLEIIILSGVSQTEKDKYHMIMLICGIFKKVIQMSLMSLCTKQKQTHRLQKQTYGYQRGNVGGGGRNKLGVGINICTLLCLK